MAMATEKLLPQNVEAEAGVLGSLLIDPDAMAQVADFLHADDFYREAHRVIYQAISDLYESRTPADLITLTDELARQGKLDEVGGASYVSSLANQVPTSANVESYAHIVERTAILRRLIHASGQIAGIAYNEPDANVALDQAEKLIFNVSQRVTHAEFEHIRDTLLSYLDKLGQLHAQRGDIVGVATGFSDLDKMTGGLQRSDLIILAARPAVGKCLTAHTLIDDPATGERLTIEECVQRRLPSVFGLSTDGIIRSTTVSDWVDSGVQPCYRVTTHSGRAVEVTGHHPFLTINGWTPLHDLHVGDTIATPRAVPAFGADDSWEPTLVRLLAYFIAEGGLTDSSPEFTNTDPVIIEDFSNAVARHFPECAIRQEKITYIVARPRRSGVAQQPNPATMWLRGLGLWGKLAREKAFPTCVWGWNRERLADFLRTLMSCDGSIYASGSGHPRIELVVASERLAADVFHALTRFGVVAKFYQKSERAWRVQITEPQSVARYQREIGWIGEKASRFATYAREAPKKSSNIGHPPRETWALVRQAARTQGLSMIELARRGGETQRAGKFAGYNPHANRTLPRARLARYAEVLRDPRLALAASPELYWDRITAIEPIGEQQVYDLTVPDGANFIAQDIIVHNTALALSLAHNASVKYKHGIAIFSLEMSAEQLIARFLSMDAGVDQQKLRTGFIDDDEWERISQSVGTLSEANIYVDDTPGVTLMEMRSKARRLMMDRGFDLLVVDYLQLMQGTVNANGRSGENRVQEISAISRGLKELARELNVPVLALSQLSRAVESRTDKKPQLSDLRESGCLAADTPVYLPDEGVYRPIKSLVGRDDVRVLALNQETWKLEPAAVSNAFDTGHKPVFRLTTRLGRSIRATANHKFLTIAGWRRLDELTAGDRIAVPRTLSTPALAKVGATASIARQVTQPACAGFLAPQDHPGAASAASRGESDTYWDEIASIEADGEDDVYDLTVEGHHNFVAGDMTVHNSIEQDADIVMFIYRDDVYNPESDRKNIADIIIAKHRNGPVGTVSLYFQPAQTRYRDLELRQIEPEY
ncbi:MAG TPA: replicative DNA helicase [Ktedonobacterales bacterium]